MFVIPMAGLSSRFFNAGYHEPKYMLRAGDKTLFALSVESFSAYFDCDRFLFIVRADFNTPDFVRLQVEQLGILNYDIVVLDRDTSGQAETVAIGLEQVPKAHDEPAYIFNIDTIRPGYSKPDFCDTADGYLETFIGSGSNWSNIEPLETSSDRVRRTAEKQEISEYCCTGLYYWSSARHFLEIYKRYSLMDREELDAGEQYIAPMYNLAIADGADIRFSVISSDEVIFCGTPKEYSSYLSTLRKVE